MAETPHIHVKKIGPAFLLNPKTDWLTVGGLSILLLPLFFAIPNDDQIASKFGWFLYAVAFVINYPHFTISYILLYGDYRHLLLKDIRFIWAGIIVPILLIGYITVAHFTQSYEMLVYFVQFMFVIVGWHYTKQTYGVIMVTSTMNKYFYTKWESWTLKFNMYSLWMTSFLFFNIGVNEQPDYWGIKYLSLGFPKEALYSAYALTAISLIVGGVLILKRIITTKQWPPFISIIGFASIYAWFLPVLFNPIYFLATPFFHSIQYFTFVFALKNNEVTTKTHQPKLGLKVIIQYMVISIVSGVLLFEGIPRVLSVVVEYNHEMFGDGLMLFIFSVSINIHHYFIDNVIWRKDNKLVQKYLFKGAL